LIKLNAKFKNSFHLLYFFSQKNRLFFFSFESLYSLRKTSAGAAGGAKYLEVKDGSSALNRMS